MDTSGVQVTVLTWLAASSAALSATAPGAAATAGLLAALLAGHT